MIAYNNIVQSNTEPNRNEIWVKGDNIKTFGPKGWTSFTKVLTIDDSYYKNITSDKLDEIFNCSGNNILINWKGIPMTVAGYTNNNGGRKTKIILAGTSSALENGSLKLYVNKVELEVGKAPLVTVEAHASEQIQDIPAASETTIGGVRIMDGSGLLVDENTGNLYVHMTDDYTEDSTDDLVPTVVALRLMKGDIEGMLPDPATTTKAGLVEQAASISYADADISLADLTSKFNTLIANLKSSGQMAKS